MSGERSRVLAGSEKRAGGVEVFLDPAKREELMRARMRARAAWVEAQQEKLEAKTREVEGLRGELAAVRRKADEDRVAHAGEVKRLEEKVCRAELDRRSIEEQMAGKDEQIGRLTKEKESALFIGRQKADGLGERVEELEAKLKRAEEANARLAAENDGLRGRLGAWEREIEKAGEAEREKDGEIEELRGRVAELAGEVMELERADEDSRGRIAELERAAEERGAECERLRAELAEVCGQEGEAEVALGACQGMLEALSGKVGFTLAVVDVVSGRRAWVGQDLEGLLGYAKGQFAHVSPELMECVIHPHDADAAGSVSGVDWADVPAERAYRLKGADGRWRWFGELLYPFAYGSGGGVVQALSVQFECAG
ncbi:chromosome segregation protein SMC [Anaerohalosphaera lusitana]|uniref:Chromosome segregation protein SMC n=1 Tax=Anaerohalosphaera lusitana TaxID=1936003 RepID=A0A1U9NPR5_9BACT|nr:hypothetical protein [Anaerohalosphaera lusitana]AQT69777.1 chromosome segregation protein SMC [Anaerohalosphaera lusitana]